MAITSPRLMTADEVLYLPKSESGELIRGELRPMPPVAPNHGDTTGTLIARLHPWARANAPGLVGPEIGFVLAVVPDTLLAPDVSYTRAERLPPEAERGRFLRLAPDLAVEVLSPYNTPARIAEKVALYLAACTRLVWIVDRRHRTVVSHASGRPPQTLHEDDILADEDVLPGFALPVAHLFFA